MTKDKEKWKKDIDNALFRIWKNNDCNALEIADYLRYLVDSHRLYKMILNRYTNMFTVRLFMQIAKVFSRWFK